MLDDTPSGLSVGRCRGGPAVAVAEPVRVRRLSDQEAAQFGPLGTFVIAGSNHPNHPALTRRLQAYLRWRNANSRRPDILAAQRCERARIRSERQRHWGQPTTRAA